MADNNVDLLDLNDDLPEIEGTDPFACPSNSKNLWKLAVVGALALLAAGYVVYKLAGKSSGSSRDEVAAIVLETPAEATEEEVEEPVTPDPDGLPQKVIEDRKEVKFNPAAGDIKVSRPKPLPASGAARSTAPAPKPAASKPAAKSGAWSVQFGSLSTRAAAEREQKTLSNNHRELFSGRNITIVAATLPNGSMTYRLRVPEFASGGDANAFCGRAKNRGLSCYAVPTGK